MMYIHVDAMRAMGCLIGSSEFLELLQLSHYQVVTHVDLGREMKRNNDKSGNIEFILSV